jgi:hypothetical protein
MIVPSAYERRPGKELEKIAPGITETILELSLFELKCEETYRKLSKGVREFLNEKLPNEDWFITIPKKALLNLDSNFEFGIVRKYNNNTATVYNFIIKTVK